MKKTNSRAFFEGTVILMTSTIIVKIMGAFFKIPLAGILGAEGMGYFMSAYSIFAPISALSLGGVSMAVSKVTAELIGSGNSKATGKCLFIAVFCFSAVGIALGIGVYNFSPFFVELTENSPSLSVMRAVSPAVALCFISAVLRGYFEGSKNMLPTGISQIVEAAIRLLAGYVGALIEISEKTAEYVEFGTVMGIVPSSASEARSSILICAATGAARGVSISIAAGVLVLIIFYFFSPKKNQNATQKETSTLNLTSRLFFTATPAALGALIANMPQIIDLATITRVVGNSIQRNPDFFTEAYANLINQDITLLALPNLLYGAYTGIALPIVSIIPSLTAAIGVNALPLIASSYAGDKKHKLKMHLEEIILLTSLISFPTGIGISVVAKPALFILFPHRRAEVEIAAELLSYMGIGIIFTALTIPITSALQGIGRVSIPVKIMFISALSKLILNILLINIDYINIKGAVISTIISSFVAFLLSLSYLTAESRIKINLYKVLFKPFFSASMCGIGAYLSLNFFTPIFGEFLSALFSSAIGAIIYVTFIILSGTFSLKELIYLTKNEKISKMT